jgi:uncharacterized DUF497 family protein
LTYIRIVYTIIESKYVWDDAKNRSNIQIHGIDFLDVVEMFQYPMVTILDDRQAYGEERWIGIGLLKLRVAVVVFIEQQENTIRIISARRATRNEQEIYKEEIENGLGAT